MYVRHNSKVRSISRLHEKRKPSNESEHGRFGMRVRNAQGNEDDTVRYTKEDHPNLFSPDRLGFPVYVVADEAAQRPEEDV